MYFKKGVIGKIYRKSLKYKEKISGSAMKFTHYL